MGTHHRIQIYIISFFKRKAIFQNVAQMQSLSKCTVDVEFHKMRRKCRVLILESNTGIAGKNDLPTMSNKAI